MKRVKIVRTIDIEDFQHLKEYIMDGYTIVSATAIHSRSTPCVEYVLTKETT